MNGLWKDDNKHKKRVGRPRWSGVFDTKCDVRLTKEESDELDRLAALNETTRGAVMRKALRDFIIFNSEELEDDVNKEEK